MLILGFLACAQKMLPPSPDRFSPGLEEIEVQNRTKINITFNEEIESKGISQDSFRITTTDLETLAIKEISLSRRSKVITLITERQKPIRYSFQAKVTDLAGNRARVQAKFMGSIVQDTIPPRILEISPKIGAIKQRKNIRIGLRFSEEIDTVIPVEWVILPKVLSSRFTVNWQSDHRHLNFIMADSLGADTVVYFVLLRSAYDFEGNRITFPGFNFFTSDSLLNTKLVTGKVTDKDEPLKDGFVLFSKRADSIQTMAIIPIDTAGSFSIQIRDGSYDVTALTDTNFDRRIDLKGEIKDFNTTAETLLIEVYPDTLEPTLDWYLR